MSFHRSFTRVTLLEDDQAQPRELLVEGVSEPPDAANAIHVVLPHGGVLRSVSVPGPGAVWGARFAEEGTPFVVGEDVFVVGVAMRDPPCDPFAWQGSFAIKSTRDP